MYVNENGQMCGPYIQEQLYEGLHTGFLPEELPVYAIVNETLMNPVPLKYFKKFPDHVSTGFAYLTICISDSTANLAIREQPFGAATSGCSDSQTTIRPWLNDNSCSSNQQMPNFEAAGSTASYPLLVL